MKIIREIIGRCPQYKIPISRGKCHNCAYRGKAWHSDLEHKPYKYTVECNYKKVKKK